MLKVSPAPVAVTVPDPAPSMVKASPLPLATTALLAPPERMIWAPAAVSLMLLAIELVGSLASTDGAPPE